VAGDAGTGKTFLWEKLLPELGVVLLNPPFPAGDFNGGVVGDSEKAITELLGRALLMPCHATCVCIDEIEDIAPNRSAAGACRLLKPRLDAVMWSGGVVPQPRACDIFVMPVACGAGVVREAERSG
jgi:hypothetical protein